MLENINYDEQQEKKLDEFLKIIYQNSLDFNNPGLVLNKLLEIYEKTNYPGVLYRIGNLYEFGFFKKLKEDKSIHYYELASNKGYVAAMNRLAEIELKNTNTHKYKYIKWAIKSADEYHNPYGKYLLAKYYLISGIFEDPMKEYFKKGIQFMKESAKLGCKEAQEYIDMM